MLPSINNFFRGYFTPSKPITISTNEKVNGIIKGLKIFSYLIVGVPFAVGYALSSLASRISKCCSPQAQATAKKANNAAREAIQAAGAAAATAPAAATGTAAGGAPAPTPEPAAAKTAAPVAATGTAASAPPPAAAPAKRAAALGGRVIISAPGERKVRAEAAETLASRAPVDEDYRILLDEEVRLSLRETILKPTIQDDFPSLEDLYLLGKNALDDFDRKDRGTTPSQHSATMQVKTLLGIRADAALPKETIDRRITENTKQIKNIDDAISLRRKKGNSAQTQAETTEKRKLNSEITLLRRALKELSLRTICSQLETRLEVRHSDIDVKTAAERLEHLKRKKATHESVELHEIPLPPQKGDAGTPEKRARLFLGGDALRSSLMEEGEKNLEFFKACFKKRCEERLKEDATEEEVDEVLALYGTIDHTPELVVSCIGKDSKERPVEQFSKEAPLSDTNRSKYYEKGLESIPSIVHKHLPYHENFVETNADFYLTDALLLDAFKAMDESINKGESIFVHCSSGENRSPMVVVLYLALRAGVSFEQAWKYVAYHRPRIKDYSREYQFIYEFLSDPGREVVSMRETMITKAAAHFPRLMSACEKVNGKLITSAAPPA